MASIKFVAVIVLTVLTALTASATYAANIGVGRDIIERTNCAACHGANLNSPVSSAYPKLAGQHADYVYWALRQYQMGGRNPYLGRANPVMAAQVQNLSEDDLRDIAAYIESLKGDLVQKK